MTTFYDFKSEAQPALHGFTDDATGAKLPEEDGPWTLVRETTSEDRWIYPVSRAVAATGIAENGFYLWEAAPRPRSSRPVIGSDRVEGTAVYDHAGQHIGTIKRLLIEKVSGHVLYVDVTFGGFLGLGVHHCTIPWEKLAYDTGLEGYRTDITAEQVKGAPTFWDDQDWLDARGEREIQGHWRPPVDRIMPL